MTRAGHRYIAGRYTACDGNCRTAGHEVRTAQSDADQTFQAVPAAGLIEVKTGAGGRIVKTTGDDVPPAVVTVTLAPPRVALLEIAKVAVSCVALGYHHVAHRHAARDAYSRAAGNKVNAGQKKLTPTLVPTVPVAGLIEVRTGGGGRIVKITGDEVPPAVATVTLAAPRVAPARDREGRRELANGLTTTTLLTVTPPVTFTVVLPETKLWEPY